ncbi:MAG TPA: amidohydrolase family protein [Candidatus Eubacterium avistercoris]|uniref:Amidohydrolase family protein n=1 Tax=Candidatus Eubacterium avistercoris TaxID=2838567 RepID=A0A9D2D2J3_9FIRM|nr:amidohydrolase family protein [Candidatus Eubacterium avistercoris]
MRIIGIEEHYQLPVMGKIRMEWAEKTNRPEMLDMELMKENVFPRLTSPVEIFRLPEMDAIGMHMQVLSSGSPSVQALDNPADAVWLAKESNNLLAEAKRKYPSRFSGFATLPLADPTAAAKELERCVTELGFCGAMIQGHQNFHFLDEEIFFPIWETAQSLNVPLSLHVIDTQPAGMRIINGCQELMGPIWTWNFETATHVMRLIINGIFDKFSKVKFIVGHMGEGLPYMLGRIDEGYETGIAHLKKPLRKKPSEYFKSNIYITTSGKYHPSAMRCAIDAVGADRILFATDYPFVSLSDAFSCIKSCFLSPEEQELIFHKNAESVLGI